MTERDPGESFQIRDRRRRAGDDAPPREAGAEPPPPAPAPEPAATAERSLVGLFAMLASLAVAALEGMPDPATGRTQRDPEQTAEIIDTLMLLREKTEGRRTAEESETLDALIYDLQLRYVQATRPPG